MTSEPISLPPRHSIETDDTPLTYPASGSRRPSLNIPYVEDTGKDIVSREGREFEGSQECEIEGFPHVLTSYIGGRRTEHIHCTVFRDRKNMMYPSYEMRLQETNELLIVAKKMSMGRMSSYHFFDMRKSSSGKPFLKKSENYLGKLRTVGSGRTEYALIDDTSEQLELAGYVYDRLDVLPKSAEGGEGLVSPRKLSVVLPPLNCSGSPIGNHLLHDRSELSLTSALSSKTSIFKLDTVHTFGTKSPVLVDGKFRLNFRGRVTVPSIKNFQLIPDDELNNIILQFGKVEEDTFHLDFKAPFNALQAFAAALSQFSM